MVYAEITQTFQGTCKEEQWLQLSHSKGAPIHLYIHLYRAVLARRRHRRCGCILRAAPAISGTGPRIGSEQRHYHPPDSWARCVGIREKVAKSGECMGALRMMLCLLPAITEL